MNEKLPISLVVITQNEERNLARCLKAADFCSEVIVVDSGSTDHTLEIAAQFGARVFHRAWTGYRDQKNFGTEQASHRWILCIDADEVVSLELRRDILTRFYIDPPLDAFELNRHSYYAGRLINHCGWYPQWRMFLYRKGKAVWGGDEPHTVVVFRGERKARLKGDIFHYTYGSVRHHILKNVAAAYDAAVAMHAKGRRANVLDLCFRSPWAFLRSYVFQLGFLDGFYGFVISLFASFYTFVKYAALWEMNLRKRESSDAQRRGESS